MTRCDDGCGRSACKTWDSDPYAVGPVRERYKALCGSCWTTRDNAQPLRRYPILAGGPYSAYGRGVVQVDATAKATE